MKKIVLGFFVCFILFSCTNDKTYYDQITDKKTLTERVKDINKSIAEVRTIEKGKLIQEDVDYMEFEYEIGKGDTYIISYLFDDKGVYEIGFDGYFAKGEDAKLVLDEFTNEINTSGFGKPQETPRLKRWLNANKSVTIELDYTDVDRGMVIVTIFANE